MQKKLINSQLCNFNSYQMYLRQLMTLAENVFEFENLPEYIDTSYLNKTLLRKGQIAFFKDDVLGILALPFITIGKLDVYGRPNKIEVYSMSDYRRTLSKDEFIIMYDNNGRYPLYVDIIQYAERLSQMQRTMDINIAQQKTSRFWKTKTENERTVRDIINNVDGYENTVLTYDNIDLDDTQIVLQPAPYVADKIDLQKDKIWNEFLRLIGIANVSYQKKERNIKDEIQAMQGGTVASRFSRFEPRKKAIDMINEKFETDIKVKYYDGLPSSDKDEEVEDDESLLISMDDSDVSK